MANPIQIDPPAQNIEKFFNEFRLDTMYLVDDFYDENIRFEDPLVEIDGRDNLRAYYENMYQGVKEIRFDWEGQVKEGDTYVVFWNMVIGREKT